MKFSLKKMLSVVISVLLIFSTFSTIVVYAEDAKATTITSTSTKETTTTKETTKKKSTKKKSTKATHPKNGWSKDKKHYYKNNKMVKGFKEIKGHTYYFGKKTGNLKTGWQMIDGQKYYFYKSKKVRGQAATGLKRIEGHYYYFDEEDCSAKSGWVTINEKKHYFFKSKDVRGQAATGVVAVQGVKYKFDEKGERQYKLNAMDLKANKLSSKTKYLILVNKSSHKFVVYHGEKGNWERLKNWKCTLGAKSTPTPSGDFTLGPMDGKPFHQLYFDSGQVRCWYATRVYHGINIHSVLYSQAKTPSYVTNGTLGANLSHGCIRLYIDNAKWVYDNIPKDTRCIIYRP